MKSPRSNHVATLLSDGRVLITGGVSSTNGSPVENSAEIYDPQTGSWCLTEHMVNARYTHQATLLMDGRVLVTGGFNVSAFHVPLQTTELYDPITNKWSIVTKPGEPSLRMPLPSALPALHSGSVRCKSSPGLRTGARTFRGLLAI